MNTKTLSSDRNRKCYIGLVRKCNQLELCYSFMKIIPYRKTLTVKQ